MISIVVGRCVEMDVWVVVYCRVVVCAEAKLENPYHCLCSSVVVTVIDVVVVVVAVVDVVVDVVVGGEIAVAVAVHDFVSSAIENLDVF